MFAQGLASRSSSCLLVALGLCCAHEGRCWELVLYISVSVFFFFFPLVQCGPDLGQAAESSGMK